MVNTCPVCNGKMNITELKEETEYELKVVKWQIEWIKNGGENWVCDEELGGDFTMLSPVCDLGFRKGVVDTLLAIGMDEEVIEEGLEKYADIWRDRFISSAFFNKYNCKWIVK